MLLTGLLLFLILGMLSHSDACMQFGILGLKAWFYGAIPALLPFMILSGIIIRMGISEKLASLIHPVTGKLFGVSKACSYVTFIGFLCGFPMGARTINESYERKRISLEEARWLLSFCNNLGPAFFCGMVLPSFHVNKAFPCLLGAYGLPLAYGFILRNTIFRNSIKKQAKEQDWEERLPFAEAFSGSVLGSVNSIAILGGYVVFFSALSGFVQGMIKGPLPLLAPLMEITTGLSQLKGKHFVFCMFAFSFGGISCLAQTRACLQNEDLKPFFGEYCLNKVLLSAMTVLYFSLLFPFL